MLGVTGYNIIVRRDMSHGPSHHLRVRVRANVLPWTCPGEQYARLAHRRAKRKAAAVGHSILVAAYHILQGGAPYHGVGPEHLERLPTDRLTCHHIQRLEQLGQRVTFDPAPQPA